MILSSWCVANWIKTAPIAHPIEAVKQNTIDLTYLSLRNSFFDFFKLILLCLFSFSEVIFDFPIIITPIPIKIRDKIKFRLNSWFKNNNDKIKVKRGKVIEIARVIVVPNSFWAIK